MVLTFAPAPAGGAGAKPAADRAAQPAAAQSSNGTKDQKPRSAPPPAPRQPAKQETPQDDDLPLMEELPEVI